MSTDLEARLERIVRAAPTLMHVLRTVRDLDLPDWFMFSGAIYQRVLNDLTGREPDYGIKDYDIAYHDASDISYEAEDAVIQRVAAAFAPELRDKVEVRNQARVHVWFEGRFGEPYPPLASSAEALDRFVSPLFAVAAKLESDDRLTIIAPFGLDDLFALRLRPNPNRPTKNFNRVTNGILGRWPEVKVTP
jgi:hypothetical protein